MPGLLKKVVTRGHIAPAAPIPKYVMPSPRPWNWPPDWPIATRDQIMAGIALSETPGSRLLKGKGLARSATVGELSEQMKQSAMERMATEAILTRPLSAQQLDCHVRQEEMPGSEIPQVSPVLRDSVSHLRSITGDCEPDVQSPTSSSEDGTVRMDFGTESDSSSASGSVRSDVTSSEEDGEGVVGYRTEKVPGLLKSKHVREGRGERKLQESRKGFLSSGKKWSSLVGSLRERLEVLPRSIVRV